MLLEMIFIDLPYFIPTLSKQISQYSHIFLKYHDIIGKTPFQRA